MIITVISPMKYLKITSPDIENGPGCRVTLWIPGCCRKCPGCHTPWTHDYNQGMDFTEDDFDPFLGALVSSKSKQISTHSLQIHAP